MAVVKHEELVRHAILVCQACAGIEEELLHISRLTLQLVHNLFQKLQSAWVYLSDVENIFCRVVELRICEVLRVFGFRVLGFYGLGLGF
jgi:predicted metal-binding protein